MQIVIDKRLKKDYNKSVFSARAGKVNKTEGQTMAILVTGGAGFIGSHTCVELLNAGEEIVVMDNFYNSNSKALDGIRKITGKDFRFYEADMLDIAEVDCNGLRYSCDSSSQGGLSTVRDKSIRQHQAHHRESVPRDVRR